MSSRSDGGEYSSSANSLGSGRPTLHELINREETRHPHSQLLDTGSTVLLFPIDNHQGFLHFKPCLTSCDDRLHDRPTAGEHIIDDERTIPGQNDSLDQPTKAMILRLLAYEKCPPLPARRRKIGIIGDRRGDGNRADLQPPRQSMS